MICDYLKMNVIQLSNYSMIYFISSVYAKLMFLMVGASKTEKPSLGRNHLYVFSIRRLRAQ